MPSEQSGGRCDRPRGSLVAPDGSPGPLDKGGSNQIRFGPPLPQAFRGTAAASGEASSAPEGSSRANENEHKKPSGRGHQALMNSWVQILKLMVETYSGRWGETACTLPPGVMS